MLKPSFNTPSLFDPVDLIQQQGHATHTVKRLTDDPPVTPDPTPAERRDTGIARAVDHANDVTPKWSARAEAYAKMMIERRTPRPFLFEEIVAAASRDGVPPPPDARAWGGVARRLARAGIIKKLGYAPAKSSNLSPKVLWGKVE